jgi:hypothetical protein
MILSDYMFPTLLLSFDDVAEDTAEIAAAVAKITDSTGTSLTDTQKTKLSAQLVAAANSDILNPLLMVPIVFYDGLIPASVKGIESSINKRVEYIGDTPVVFQGNNTVTVRINIKNSLSEVSAIANAVFAIADKLASQVSTESDGVSYRMSTRASFYSSTFSISDAYLTAINRSTVDGSDIEVIHLTFEKTVPPADTSVKEADTTDTDLTAVDGTTVTSALVTLDR